MKRLKANKINFIPRLAEVASADARKKQKINKLLPIIIALLLIIGVSSYFAIRIYFVIMPQLKELQLYLNNATVQADYTESIDLQKELESWNAMLDQQKNAFETINSYPEMTDEVYQTLFTQTKGKIDIFNIQYLRSEGTIVLDCNAPGPLEAAGYAKAVENTGYFTYVRYYGYESSKDTAESSSGQNDYEFNVVCGIFPMGGVADE